MKQAFSLPMPFTLPRAVKIVEVGPRDGLQNESAHVPTARKLAFILGLVQAGLKHIEATSFVHPQWVPQLADAAVLMQELKDKAQQHKVLSRTEFSALVPNMKGLERAMAVGTKRIAVFTAASETFTQRNIQMSISESIEAFRPVVRTALSNGMSVRGYLSTCFVCPYEGEIDKDAVTRLTGTLFDLGVDEVSLGDTIGAAAPSDVFRTVGDVLKRFPKGKIALHFHDTYGTALANVLAGLELGIATFDSSAGGLGGCPYAPGASGNLATEDLVYFLERMGIATGVNLEALAKVSLEMQEVLGKTLPSKQLQRLACAKAKG